MIELKQYDLARPIEQTLLLGASAINLTGTTVILLFRQLPKGAVQSRAAEIVDAAAGRVRYQPVADDVAADGKFELEWRIIYPGNLPLTVPTNARETMTIFPSLAAP
jgi:hypothetical protein